MLRPFALAALVAAACSSPAERDAAPLSHSTAALAAPTPLAELGSTVTRGDTNPLGLVAYRDAGYFFGSGGFLNARHEMYRTDGTAAGTAVLHELEGYFVGQNPGVPQIVELDGGIYWSEAY